ncbi:hypothetical protein GGH99_004630 [Coemansia sp. RSA 1285]|nr:hypothetical protein GGH99_004630 [Coemansia sp. RSA 1285]
MAVKNSSSGDPVDDDYIDIDDTGPEGLKGADGGYAWEEEYKRSWDAIQEDDSGSIQSAVKHMSEQQLRRKRQRPRDTSAIQRGIIRHVAVVVDQSDSMGIKDMHPSRIHAALAELQAFVGEFFDQNPISQIAVIATKDGLAEKLSDLSGNPGDHVAALADRRNRDLAGDPSVQNALELAMHTLRRAPAHGAREIVCVLGSLTTCDPGDIERTLDALKRCGVRVSIVHLAAEVHVYRRICRETQGLYSVPESEHSLRDALFDHVAPPPVVSARSTADMIQMGFPIKASYAPVPTPCVCHHVLSFSGYICPRCRSKVCSLPTDCDVCGLPLVSAPHLARSYHHMFPEENYEEEAEKKQEAEAEAVETESKVAAESGDSACYGCGAHWIDSAAIQQHQQEQQVHREEELMASASAASTAAAGSGSGSGSGRFRCPRCKHQFCLDCDVFVHDTLHNCPGCV